MKDTEEHERFVTSKRISRMETIDRFPEDVRKLIHEYGLNVVRAFLDIGVKKPNQIRHLIETVLDELSPTRGTFSNQGIRGQLIIRDRE
jgi:hypothetical protein